MGICDPTLAVTGPQGRGIDVLICKAEARARSDSAGTPHVSFETLTMAIFSTICLKVYKILWTRLRDSPLLNVRVGGRTVRGHLAKISSAYLFRTIPNPMQVCDHKIYHCRDTSEALRMATGSYELDTSRLICQLLQPGQTFVDVGAHIGYFVLAGARAVGPAGHVYAFEPVPANLTILRKNIEANGYQSRVTVVPKAASNESGSSPFFLSSVDSMWHTSLSRWGGTKIEVETTTLDAFFRRNGWPPVHLVKVDVEGTEKAALEGMGDLCRHNPHLRLIVEFAAGSFEASDDEPEDVFQVLRDLGFVRLSIISQELIPIGSHREMLDHLCSTAGATDWWTNLLCEK
jgi:FkbM family methyltransferase